MIKYVLGFLSNNGSTLMVRKERGPLINHGLWNGIGGKVEEGRFAWGSGKEVALGALWAGENAVGAVRAAINYNTMCGQGIDVVTLTDMKLRTYVEHRSFRDITN